MKNWLRPYLTLTRLEYRGILCLIGLIVITAFIPTIYDRFNPPSSIDYSTLKKYSSYFSGKVDSVNFSAREVPWFTFNPNVVSEDTLILLGLTNTQITELTEQRAKRPFKWREDVLWLPSMDKYSYLNLYKRIRIPWPKASYASSDWHSQYPDHYENSGAPIININEATASEWAALPGIGKVLSERVVKYRNAIGGFNQLEQVKKVYGISDSLFEILKPQLVMDAAQDDTDTYGQEKYQAVLDVNLADSASLVRLPGIGPYFASKIIGYRQRLGGFIRADQLLEVYGLPKETFEQIKDRVIIGENVQQLSLNQASQQRLEDHPYISQSLARFIIAYRINKPFEEVAQLKTSFLVDDALYRKIAPYLKP